MRPLKLTLQGFTCFKEQQVIDFSDLDLFAIQGQTGSGKSSLLDAMMYALYGQTPRLGRNGLEALLSQGSKNLVVRLEFALGSGQYAVTRSRGQKSRESQLRLEKFEGGKWVTGSENTKIKELDADIAKLLGLAYEGFTRAIVLPQGEFDRFLRGDAKERRELLKDLLGMHEIEEMRVLASSIASNAKTRAQLLQAQLSGEYSQVSGEAKALLQTRQEQLREQITQLDFALAEGRVALTEGREVARLQQELAQVRINLAQLERQSQALAAAEQRAKQARQAATLLPLLAALENAQKKQQEAEARGREHTNARRVALEAEAKASASFETANQAAKTTPGLEAQVQELRAARPLMERLRLLGGSLKTEHHRPLVWSEGQASALASLEARWRDLEQSNGQYQERLAEAEAASAKLGGLLAKCEPLAQALAACKSAGIEAKKQLEAAKGALAEAERHNLAAQLISGLGLGDPCPICGQPLRRLTDFGPDLTKDLRQQLDSRQHHLGELREQYKTLEAEHKNNASAIEETNALDLRQKTRLSQSQSALGSLERDIEPLLAAFALAKASKTALGEAKTRLLAGLAAQIREVTGGADPDLRIRSLNAERERLLAALEQAREGQSNSRNASLRAASTLEQAQQHAHERLVEAQAQAAQWREALATSSFGSAEAVRAAQLTNREIEALERSQREHLEQRGANALLQAQVLEKLAGRVFDGEKLARLEATIPQYEQQLRQHERELARLGQELADLTRRLEQAKRLKRELSENEQRYTLYQGLAQDLRGSEFQDFLLRRVQNDLLARASAIVYEVTQQRYTLVLLDDEYAVLDHWNLQEARSIKTLSGGETFIASLALALALSDYLAGHQVLGALFLDEGFGSLDPESLDAVAAMLETLQTAGRMVGVITHVASLADRLPQRLIVEKGSEGSRAYWG
jgi:DNA repair protein SbcC/Rad50